MQWSVETLITDFFTSWFGSAAIHMEQLPPSGSGRQYFRLHAADRTFIAAFNPDIRENRAFIHMSRHFRSLGMPVPEVLAEGSGTHVYLLNDLGDTSLFSLLPHDPSQPPFTETVTGLYKQTIDWLPVFQVEGAKGLDFSLCYPRENFDRYSMMWDLNYFKYYFLKISGIAFDEQLLEDSFEAFVSHLLQADSSFFMYRDFQSRNVMVLDGQVYFIDFQGGRRGPLQYDIASLLFDAKANIPFALRDELLDYYLEKASGHTAIDQAQFRRMYYDFVLIRVMQALAAYGFRGGVEKKPIFLQSMPYALNNLKWMAEHHHLPEHIPYLTGIIEKVVQTLPIEFPPVAAKRLTITIRSFSYRKGIPTDLSGHGGGFVFDCRVLPNPGRMESFKALTGQDQAVAEYLARESQVTVFMEAAATLVEKGIETYLERGMHHLMVCFGCTGGQHRSVYCAEKMAALIGAKYPVSVDLKHQETINWPKN